MVYNILLFFAGMQLSKYIFNISDVKYIKETNMANLSLFTHLNILNGTPLLRSRRTTRCERTTLPGNQLKSTDNSNVHRCKKNIENKIYRLFDELKQQKFNRNECFQNFPGFFNIASFEPEKNKSTLFTPLKI